MTIPQGPYLRLSLDFVSDSFVCGRRFRILCVVDDFSRECLALMAEWQNDYSTVRPHSKLAGRTTAKITKQAVPGHAPALLVIPSTISQTIEGLYL